MILLMNFDGKKGRLELAKSKIPEDLTRSLHRRHVDATGKAEGDGRPPGTYSQSARHLRARGTADGTRRRLEPQSPRCNATENLHVSANMYARSLF